MLLYDTDPFIVLIVAKCIVNRITILHGAKRSGVLIVAKCIVNVKENDDVMDSVRVY